VLVAEAATRIALTRSTAGVHLRRLEHAGLLVGDLIEGGRLRYSLTPAGQAAIKDSTATAARRARKADDAAR
jgi:DNA-binding MarR family transcriptional regulator